MSVCGFRSHSGLLSAFEFAYIDGSMSKNDSSNEIPAASEEANQKRVERKALEHAEVPEVIAFFQKHGITIVVSVALAVMAYVGRSVWLNVQQAKEVDAMNLLMTARSPDQLDQILTDFPESTAAPIALFSQAAGRYDEGSFQVARDLFVRFGDAYGDHDLAPNAKLAIAQCDEALGALDQALQGFEQFAAEHPDHYLVPMAQFGRGRCLEQLGRYDEAIAAFQEYIDVNPDGPWAARAETSIKFVEMSQRASARGETAPASLEPIAVPSPAEGAADSEIPVFTP